VKHDAAVLGSATPDPIIAGAEQSDGVACQRRERLPDPNVRSPRLTPAAD